MSILIQGGTIITGNHSGDILKDTSLLIDNNRIKDIVPEDKSTRNTDVEIFKASGLVIIPGFVQTHVHLCQTLFRGLADDLQLIDWLREKIFPMEAAHNELSMYYSAKAGIAELIRSGTTTILDMGSINYEEEIIRAISETGLRAFVGKAMMDVNDIFPGLKEPTKDSLKSTLALAESWHNTYNDRIKYAVAPRFVLSCSDTLMRDAYEMTNDFTGMLFHTHASENLVELETVRRRCKMDNVEFLHHLGLLSERSCLAHCIHLNENEVNILQATKSNISHCPSSNLKLGSGIANIPRLMQKNITISLGADGAPCNNNLDMFKEMRLASLLQKPFHGPAAMDAKTIFDIATINGAKALGLESEIGSIEVGKKADITILNLSHIQNPYSEQSNIYSSIVFSSSPENVDSVMIDGKWVYRQKEYCTIDERDTISKASEELKKLLDRL
jgi:cytosine/adenosine deaminase-related metal-dependent hydrolase